MQNEVTCSSRLAPTAVAAMDGTFGFRVQVQDKTLATGQIRVKPNTVATVIGVRYVSAAARGPVNLTLTDKGDSSEWHAQLTCDGVTHYVINGLDQWLAHCRAKVGEAMELFREANDSRLYVLLRREVSTTANISAGPDASQQQLAPQHDKVPVGRCESEGEAAAARPPEQHTTADPAPTLHVACAEALSPAPAAAAPPAEGVQGAQAGPSMPERSSCGTTAPAHATRGLSTGASPSTATAPPDPNASSSVPAGYPSGPPQRPTATMAWHPGAPLAPYAAVAVPQQLVPVRRYVRVPLGHGASGGSGWPPPAADLWRAYGHPYGGAPFRPVYVNQRPLIANQQGPPGAVAGVGGVHGWTGLGGADGLRLRRYRLHPGHLPAATGMAAGTAGGGMAAGSGACGSGAAAGAAVRGYDDAPLGEAVADLQGAMSKGGLPLGPLAEGMGYPQPGNGGNAARAEGPSGERWSRCVGEGASSGGQPPAARAACTAALGTRSGGGPSDAAGLQAAGLAAPDAGAGVAMLANMHKHIVRLRKQVAVALWPGLAEHMPVNQPQEVLLHIECTPPAAQRGQPESCGLQQGEALRVYPVKLVRYGTTGFRLTGVMAAVRALGVSLGDKDAVGLRRLPCGRVLLERWRQQEQGQGRRGQERGGMHHTGAPIDQMPLGEAKGGGDGVPPPKRRRLQGLAPGGSGTAASGREAVTSNTTASPCPGQPDAPAAEAEVWDVRTTSSLLSPPLAATRQLWPLEAAALKENQYPDHTVPVTLFTAACNRAPAVAAESSRGTQQVGGGQGPAEQHTVLLHYMTASRQYRIKQAAGVIAALGLRGGDTLRLRRSPDGRAWAEQALPPAANQQPHPTLAASADPPAAGTAAAWGLVASGVRGSSSSALPPPTTLPPASPPPICTPLHEVEVATRSTTALELQQPAPGLAAASAAPVAVAPATDTTSIGDGRPYTSSFAYSPMASPARSTDPPDPVLGPAIAPSTTTTTATAPLCVSGGCLQPARPIVAALWPECVDMPLGTQQLVRMRAVLETGGGGDTAAAAAASLDVGSGRAMAHYGSQLARPAGGAWRLERTQPLVRELRLGAGDRVELVPLEGGVVGVRRARAAAAGAVGQTGARGDGEAAAAAGEKGGGRGATGGWTGEAGSCIGGVVDSGGQGVGAVPAASTHAAWLKGLAGAAYEEGAACEERLHGDCHVLRGADPHQQQHVPRQEGQEEQRGKGQDGEETQGQDQEQGEEQQEVYTQRQGQVQCQQQRPQHHVGANTCRKRQRCIEQRSALPVESEQVSQVPRLETGQAAMQQQDEQRGEGRNQGQAPQQALEAPAASAHFWGEPFIQQHQHQQLKHQQQQQQHQKQQQRQEQQCTSGAGTAGCSADQGRGGMGVACIRGQGQQQERSPGAHLPASSLTSAHLHGCLPPGLAPPPLQPGELRLCGLTFHPDLAPGVRRAMADWGAGLGGTPLHEVEPEAGQVRVLGAGQVRVLGAGDAAGGNGIPGGAASDSAALTQQYQLSPSVLAIEVVKLLGLEEEEDWGMELPHQAPVRAGLERRMDGQRGGWGLWATGAVRKSHPVGVVGGYVMPAAAAKRFVDLGWRDCSEGVKAEVRQRVGGDGGRARVSYGWKMLAASYTMPYPAELQPAQVVPPEGGSGGGDSNGSTTGAPVLSMLGYGNPTALANDPRVNPRAWQHGHDVDADQEQLGANCGVVTVSVRGLVLPVLVALRDIAPGEQLLRDYGAAWWREVAGVWEVAEDQGLGGEALWHGTCSNA